MNEKPSIATTIGPRLLAVPRADQPVLVAYAERVAARRYRAWADQVGAEAAAELRACAEREEEIAARVEALYPQAVDTQQAYLAEQPGLEAAYAELFEGRPLSDQFGIQADGERLGAATWRRFAAEQEDPARRAVFLACAELEEASAQVLDRLRQ